MPQRHFHESHESIDSDGKCLRKCTIVLPFSSSSSLLVTETFGISFPRIFFSVFLVVTNARLTLRELLVCVRLILILLMYRKMWPEFPSLFLFVSFRLVGSVRGCVRRHSQYYGTWSVVCHAMSSLPNGTTAQNMNCQTQISFHHREAALRSTVIRFVYMRRRLCACECKCGVFEMKTIVKPATAITKLFSL